MAEATLSKVNIQPLGDRVLVKPVEAKESKRGGIIIPDSAKEKPQEGVVAACGKGRTTPEGKIIALDVKVGDKVLFGKYSGTEVKVDGDDVLVMREEDIMAIIEGK